LFGVKRGLIVVNPEPLTFPTVKKKQYLRVS
jgi:hypothetical protein